MGSSVLTVVACTPILAGWLAVRVFHCLAVRRRRRQDAEWTALAAALSDLDTELDRTWAAERERIRRYW
jgi:hypothetical protein